MNYLKHTTLAAAIALASATIHAELKPLTDENLSNMTGQAGITIDVNDLKLDIGELNYKDQGNLYFSGIRIGGAGLAQQARGEAITHEMGMDNFQWVIDVAGATDGAALESNWGYAGVTLGSVYIVEDSGGNHGQTVPTIEDGDLVIQARLLDHTKGSDFGILIDRVALGGSHIGAGDDYMGNNTDGTVIASDIVISGWNGPAAFVFDASEDNLNFSTSFESKADITFDFIATKLQMKMHNSRGNDRLIWAITGEPDPASFFHFQADIGAASNGLKLNVTDFSGDIDLTNITFGLNAGAVSIGDVYITDFTAQADMVVYGH